MTSLLIISIVSIILGFNNIIDPVFAVEDGELVPVIDVACSNLHTGIWYKITLGERILTWAYDKTSGGYNHVKLVDGSGTTNFMPGAKYEMDTHWMILLSEIYGYYMIINRGAPHSYLTWGGKSTSGKWMVIVLDSDSDKNYQKGGIYRPDILWKFQRKDSDPKYKSYNMINYRYRDGSGIATYSDEDHGTGVKYCQIYTDGQKKNFENDKAYLWMFEHVGPTVSAKGKDSDRKD